MLEIVHDMAPGAGLMFDTQNGVAGHAAAQANLVANGADVITEDLAFDTEPAFQSGLLASTGDAIAAAGVPVHSSAGNMGQRHAARVTATGTGGGPDGRPAPTPVARSLPTTRWRLHPGTTRRSTSRWEPQAEPGRRSCSSGASRARSSRPSGKVGSPTSISM